MSVVEGPTVPDRVDVPGSQDARRSTLPDLCPYLSALDGTWRSATAVRDHRCVAVSPPVQLAAEKQRRLCLVEQHVDCATYTAAVARRATTTLSHPARPVARMTPVILDHGRFDLRLPTLRGDRPTGQAALVAVLAIAFVGILLARPSGESGAPAGAGSRGTPSPAASGPVPTGSVVASPTRGPDATAPHETAPAESPAETAPAQPPSVPPASTAPSARATEPVTSGATYRVKSGDTLSAIAARFDTTVGIIVRLNGITDPSKLKVGQVLKLP